MQCVYALLFMGTQFRRFIREVLIAASRCDTIRLINCSIMLPQSFTASERAVLTEGGKKRKCCRSGAGDPVRRTECIQRRQK